MERKVASEPSCFQTKQNSRVPGKNPMPRDLEKFSTGTEMSLRGNSGTHRKTGTECTGGTIAQSIKVI